VKRLGILLIRAYQVTLGPLLGGSCRFEPSCSNYGLQAVERFGLVRGSWLTARRLLRCRPFGPHGYDPVPESWPGFFGGARRRAGDAPAGPSGTEPDGISSRRPS
jgi:putative membrane protein insertion efficiency factor